MKRFMKCVAAVLIIAATASFATAQTPVFIKVAKKIPLADMGNQPAVEFGVK